MPGGVVEHGVLGAGAKPGQPRLQAGEELLAVVRVGQAVVVAEAEDAVGRRGGGRGEEGYLDVNLSVQQRQQYDKVLL